MKNGLPDKKPLKILIMNRYDPFSHVGGIEIFVRNLSLELSKFFEVHVVFECARKMETRKNEVILHPIYAPIFPCFFYLSPNPKDLLYFFRKRRFLKENSNEFDVIICQDWTGCLAYLTIQHRSPFLWYSHDTGPAVSKMLSFVPLRFKLHYIIFFSYITFVEKTISRKADLVIAIAKCVKDDVHRYYSVPFEKIVVNYHGLPRNFTDGFSISLPTIPTFLHIATDHARKGTKYLLDALRVLKERYNINVRAIIVGSKDPYYLKMAKDLNVDVSFVGNILESELKQLYASCTCLVVPSIREGFCLPIIEAASFGKPSIVTDVGSLPELVKDYVDGLVVPLANSNLLAQKMYLLATDQDLLQKLSSNVKRDFEGFTMRSTAQRLVNVIGSILKTRNAII